MAPESAPEKDTDATSIDQKLSVPELDSVEMLQKSLGKQLDLTEEYPEQPEEDIRLKELNFAYHSVKAEPYDWPIATDFSAKNTALVIIDMQNEFCSHGGYMEAQGYSIEPARKLIPVITALLHAFRFFGFPVYHTREGHRADLSSLSVREHLRSKNNPKGLGIGDLGKLGRFLVRGEKGHDIIDELKPLDGEPIIDKPGRSAFANTDFKLLLDIKGIKNLVICGVTTDVCVHSTMRDANDMGFDCLLVADACAAGMEKLHLAAVASVGEEGGIFGSVADTKDVLDAFKVLRTSSPRKKPI